MNQQHQQPETQKSFVEKASYHIIHTIEQIGFLAALLPIMAIFSINFGVLLYSTTYEIRGEQITLPLPAVITIALLAGLLIELMGIMSSKNLIFTLYKPEKTNSEIALAIVLSLVYIIAAIVPVLSEHAIPALRLSTISLAFVTVGFYFATEQSKNNRSVSAVLEVKNQLAIGDLIHKNQLAQQAEEAKQQTQIEAQKTEELGLAQAKVEAAKSEAELKAQRLENKRLKLMAELQETAQVSEPETETVQTGDVNSALFSESEALAFIGSLSDTRKQILMAYEQDKPYSVIAEIAGCNKGTVSRFVNSDEFEKALQAKNQLNGALAG